MTGLFSTVLNMSLIGSFTAAAVLLIRWFLKGEHPGGSAMRCGQWC